jgi:hypothetical protein
MTFLNPLVLLGLIAATIPIILHLLNLRKLRTIEFSTLAFLKELQRSKMRRVKIRQILLLVLRTLLIVLIVLAFARPAFRGYLTGGIGSHAKTTVVIILDDSFSMDVSDEHGQLFKQAKEITLQLVNSLNEGDEAALIKLSDLPNPPVERPTYNYYSLRNVIQEASIARNHTNVDDALTFSAKMLGESQNFNKEVYLITDAQKSHFLTERKKAQGLRIFDPNVKFFMIPLGGKGANNSGLESIEVKTRIFEKDKSVAVSAAVKNYGNIALSNYLTSIYLDGTRVMQKGVDVGAGETRSVEFSVVPQKVGYVSGFVEIEEDALAQDNRKYFTFYVPDKIKLLLVGNAPKDLQFLKLALVPNTGQGSPATFEIQEAKPDKLVTLNLSNYSVVVLSDVRSFSEGDANRIKSYLGNGGGVLLFPGSDVDIRNYNNTLLSALQLPAIQGTNGSISDKNTYTSFGAIDFDHPIFIGIFEEKQLAAGGSQRKIESPRIYFSFALQSSASGQSIINTSIGPPLLCDYKVGNGKLLFYGLTPNLDWSDLPLKGIFVPLINRSIFYLSAKDEREEAHTVGDKFDVLLSAAGSGADKYIIKGPNGEEAYLKSRPVQNGVLCSIENSDMPGVYEVYNNGQLVKRFPVNINPAESDLSRLNEGGLEDFLGKFSIESRAVKFVSRDDNLKDVILQSRYGVELWKYCLILALIVAAIEMLVARESKKSMEATA